MEVKSRPHVSKFNNKYILNKYMRSENYVRVAAI